MKVFSRLVCAVVLVFAVGFGLRAQESLDVGEIYLGSSGCRVFVGSGSPADAVSGKTCDVYLQTDSTGGIWVKTTSSGTSGWGLALTPSPGSSDSVLQGGDPPTFSDSPTVDNLTVEGADGVQPSTGYTSNLGSLTKKYLTLHAAELWVENLVAQDTLATIGGRVVVAPTTELTSDLTDSATSIAVKHNNLASGDRVMLEANGSYEAMAITSSASGSGPYTYSVTRDLDGSGANAWPAGSAVLNTGASGDGMIDLYSVHGIVDGDAAGPTIVGDVRTGTDYNALEPRWALGNLDGLYGYSSTTYGAAFGDPDGSWLKIDATNGLRIGHGSDTPAISLTASGDASFTGAVTATSGDVTDALAAGSITTDKLAVGAGGGALNADPGMADATAWQLFGTTNGTFETVTDGQVGTHVFRSASGAYSGLYGAVPRVPLDPNKVYRIHGAYRRIATVDGSLFMGVSLFDADGNVLDNTGTAHGNGSLWWYACTDTNAGTTLNTWETCDAQFGSGTTKTFPSNARSMEPLALLNVSSTTGRWEVQDLRIEEALPSTLIQDGVITTNKLAANAVTAAKIAANTITAGQIASDTITASQIAANAITTSELASDSVTSAKIVAGTIVASDIATGTITADRMNVSSLSAITANLGTVTAGTINGVTIVGGTLTAGSGSEVFLSSDGITIEDGTGDRNAVKWGDGSSKIWGTDTSLDILADDVVQIGCCDTDITLSRSAGTISTHGVMTFDDLGGTGSSHVCADADGKLYRCD